MAEELSKAGIEKRLYRLEKAMNGRYSKKQKKEMGEEIVRLNKLLETTEGQSYKETTENEGIKAMIIMITLSIIVILVALYLFFFKGAGLK